MLQKALLLFLTTLGSWASNAPSLDFFVQSDAGECHGSLGWITDDFLEADWADYGFGGCAGDTIDGSVTMSFDEPKFIAFVRIFTPSTGHMRNDHYQLEVCENGICLSCDDIPIANAAEWSEAQCGIIGNEVVLTKKVPTQIQLIEIDIHGWESRSFGSEETTEFNGLGNGTSAIPTTNADSATTEDNGREVSTTASRANTMTPTDRVTVQLTSTTTSDGSKDLKLPLPIIVFAILASKLTIRS